ncbi:MAG: hypothetical protein MUE85_20640 [Microscillaceae bacterium]|jgi:hypothetical protein|nr:hypothetical protein [Microscillaceae bacterium]
MPKITFKKPKSILFLHTQTQHWDKTEYRALATHTPTWDRKTVVSPIKIQANQLWIEEAIGQSPQFLRADIILLSTLESSTYLPSNFGRHKINHFLQLRTQSEENELYLDLKDDFYSMFGSPKRDNFSITPLKPQQSVEILLNAKIWHTLAGARRATEYWEFNYFVAHWGIFHEAETTAQPPNQILALQADKTIDLRVILY